MFCLAHSGGAGAGTERYGFGVTPVTASSCTEALKPWVSSASLAFGRIGWSLPRLGGREPQLRGTSWRKRGKLGLRTVWYAELVWRAPSAHGAMVQAATQRLIVASGTQT